MAVERTTIRVKGQIGEGAPITPIFEALSTIERDDYETAVHVIAMIHNEWGESMNGDGCMPLIGAALSKALGVDVYVTRAVNFDAND